MLTIQIIVLFCMIVLRVWHVPIGLKYVVSTAVRDLFTFTDYVPRFVAYMMYFYPSYH